MLLASHLWIILTTCLVFSTFERVSSKSITNDATSQHQREKRGSGCCRDKGDGQVGDKAKKCRCQDEDGGDGKCCKDNGEQGQCKTEDCCCREEEGGDQKGGTLGDSKRDNKCCQDNDDAHGGGGNNDGGCRQDNPQNDISAGSYGHKDGCCQDEGEGQNGDCCQIDNNANHPHQGGCCQDTMINDPNRYERDNVQPYVSGREEVYDDISPITEPPQAVPLHKEEMMKSLLGEPFLKNVREADENTLLFFSTMLAKLQSFMENLKFQMEEVRGDLHLKFQGFDNWATHTDRVIDSAIAVIRRRTYEVQWSGKKHSDFKDERF